MIIEINSNLYCSLMNPEDLMVTCGQINREQNNKSHNRTVIKTSIHPGYNLRFQNHYALLFLDQDYALVENEINVACLPNMTTYNDFDAESCIATGWGESVEYSGKY